MIENIFQDEAATSNANPASEANKTRSAQGWHSHNVMTLKGQNYNNITSMRDYVALTQGELIPYSQNHLRRLEAKGQFPKRIRIGENRVAWLKDEIDSWIEERVKARAGDAR
jgi:prophage regulatory protein